MKTERLQEYGLQRYHFVHSALSDVNCQVRFVYRTAVCLCVKAGTAVDVVVQGTRGRTYWF